MKLLILAVLMSATTVFAETTITFHGEQATAIDTVIGGIHLPGVLHIRGYITERAHPPVSYIEQTFKLSGATIPLKATDDQINDVKDILDSVGIEPGIDAGGTTYLELDVPVDCESAVVCTVTK